MDTSVPPVVPLSSQDAIIKNSVNEDLIDLKNKQLLENNEKDCLEKESRNIQEESNKISIVNIKEPNTQLQYYCRGCEKNFCNGTALKYHIRRAHFNLKSRMPYCQRKRVNQIWFENVMNSNKVIEVRKSSPNTLILRRLGENTAIKVNDLDTEVIDVSSIYPTYSPTTLVICEICNKKVFKHSLVAHNKKHKSVT